MSRKKRVSVFIIVVLACMAVSYFVFLRFLQNPQTIKNPMLRSIARAGGFGKLLKTETYTRREMDAWNAAEQSSLAMLEILTNPDNTRGIDPGQIADLKRVISEKLDIATAIYLDMSEGRELTPADRKSMERFAELDADSKRRLADILGLKMLLRITPTATPRPSHRVLPTLTPKTAGFFPEGPKDVEPGVRAEMVNAVPNPARNLISATIMLASYAESEREFLPSRLRMVSPAGATAGTLSVTRLTLRPLDIKTVTVTFERFYDGPYTFEYLNAAGDPVTLGKFTQR